MEKKLIKLIKSLNRIMDTWGKLVIRRTLVNSLTIILFTQIIITTIFWIFGREISQTWLGILGIEFTAWGTMLAFYFKARREEKNHHD